MLSHSDEPGHPPRVSPNRVPVSFIMREMKTEMMQLAFNGSKELVKASPVATDLAQEIDGNAETSKRSTRCRRSLGTCQDSIEVLKTPFPLFSMHRSSVSWPRSATAETPRSSFVEKWTKVLNYKVDHYKNPIKVLFCGLYYDYIY